MIQRQLNFDAPIARKSDPATSHLAAERIAPKLAGRRAELLAYIVAHPGCTGAEVEAFNPQLRKRISELFRLKLIRKGEPRASVVSGHAGDTWFAN